MNDPAGEPNPLQGLLGDLLKVIGASSAGGTAWLDAARSLAVGVATDGQPEANPDPLQRIRLQELARVAELHIADLTGYVPGSGRHAVTVTPVGRGTYALRVLDAWRPVLQEMVGAQEAGPTVPGASGGLFGDLGAGGMQDLLGRFATTMGPVLLGMQFGSAAGHLAQRSLGQYALPLPWPESDELLVVPQNVTAFAEDWSLPPDETLLWACVRELATHTVLSRPHVADRMTELLQAAGRQAVAVQQELADRLGGAGDPDALQRLMADPESLLADLLTPGQHHVSQQLTALATAIGSYVDHVTSVVATSLTGSAAALGEAWYRFRIEDGKGEQAAGALFGLELGREQVDRGAAFVRGVVERAGDGALARLWERPRNLPTPAEVDAPGLWLERIDLPDDELTGGGAHGDGLDPGTGPDAEPSGNDDTGPGPAGA